MESVLNAIHDDKVHGIGALAWSFADNWEFGDFEQQFRLQVVNRTTKDTIRRASLILFNTTLKGLRFSISLSMHSIAKCV